MGSFHSISNILVGKLLGIPISRAHTHSFFMSFTSLQLAEGLLVKDLTEGEGLLPVVLKYQQ